MSQEKFYQLLMLLVGMLAVFLLPAQEADAADSSFPVSYVPSTPVVYSPPVAPVKAPHPVVYSPDITHPEKPKVYVERPKIAKPTTPKIHVKSPSIAKPVAPKARVAAPVITEPVSPPVFTEKPIIFAPSAPNPVVEQPEVAFAYPAPFSIFPASIYVGESWFSWFGNSW